MATSPIPYGKQEITEEDIAAVVQALRSPFLTQGPRIQEFEAAFAAQVGAKYAVAVANGTAALHLCALAMGVQPGQRVLVSPNTFSASANCVRYCGGEVEFVDIDPLTYCMSPQLLEEKIKQHPNRYQGIIPTDYAGHPLPMEQIKEIADRYGLWIIQDSCHALGGSILSQAGKNVAVGAGEFSDLSIFSFHPAKHITTGEGGMITTHSLKLQQHLQRLRTHGITKNPADYKKTASGGWYHEMQELGFNYRLPDILAALGLSQLKRLPQNLQRRQEIAARYQRELSALPLVLPQVMPGAKHAYHLYVIQSEKRRELYDFLKAQEIHCQVHYVPVHQMPYYEERYGVQSFLQAEKFYARNLSIPMYHSLSDAEQTRVIAAINGFFR